MSLLPLIKSLFSRKPAQRGGMNQTADAPSAQDMQAAINHLDTMARTAIFGEIGGGRPNLENRATSWWGGNFLCAPGEDIPVCNQSGRAMHPVLQIRVDELPECPPALSDVALLTLWMDLQSSDYWSAENGAGFIVRTYADIRHLVPIGAAGDQHAGLPVFPVFWRETIAEQPSWEDTAGEVPQSVAQSSQDDWFFKSKYASDHYYTIRGKYPLKVGGWPTWIQGANWPKDAQFAFQVDSTEKGKMFIGDAGSIYLFKTPGSWANRADCF